MAPIRCLSGYSTQLVQQHAQAQKPAQSREAEALATQGAQVQSRQFACAIDAEGAIAEYAGRGPGRRGRAAARWRYHAGGYQVEAQRQRQTRSKRGRPRKDEMP